MSTTAPCAVSNEVARVGPLTTIFTPPAACLRNVYSLFGDVAWLGRSESNCLPSSTSTPKVSQIICYSPGICPLGYTSACEPACLKSVLLPSETGIKCCPSGYSCMPNGQQCVSILSTPTAATAATAATPNPPTIFTLTPSPTISILAFPVRVLYQSSDLSILKTATVDYTSATRTAPQGLTPSNHSSGLSNDKKIAIGVAVPVVSIITILALFYFLWWRRGERLDNTVLHRSSDTWTRPESEGHRVRVEVITVNKSSKAEIEGREVQQLPNVTARKDIIQSFELPVHGKASAAKLVSANSQAQGNVGATGLASASKQNDDDPDMKSMELQVAKLAVAGKLAEAADLLHQVVERSKATVGVTDPETWRRLLELGSVLSAAGRPAEAEQVFRELRLERQKMFGPDFPGVFIMTDSICEELVNQGKYQQAEEMLRQDVLRREEVLGRNHRLTALGIAAMGKILKGPEVSNATAMRFSEITGRPQSPVVTIPSYYENEVIDSNPSPEAGIEALIRDGRFAAAVDLGQQVVQQNKIRLSPEHQLTVSSMFELGRAFHGDGRVEKALRVFQELLPLSERGLGPCHAYTLATLDAISEELCNMGKYELSLTHLIEERQRCEQDLGPQHERTIRVLVDIANMSKLLDKTDEASSAFSLALDRSKRGLGERHDLTLAILNDLRGLKGPLPPNLEEMKALLYQNGLPVSTEPFPNSRSATWRETVAGKELHIGTNIGYEASNAMSLRIGPINGELKPRPPVQIPPYYADTSKVNLGHLSTHAHLDHSFQSLINRSIKILPRGGASATQQAVDKHTAFLKSLKSLDELLTAKENPVWFFQHRESFMRQTTFQRWDPNSLKRYVLLPIEGGFANSEDCIFISHYWRTQSHPDPDGEDLRQLQQLLNDGFWSKAAFLWVDWTCLPQWERTAPQQQYFSRVLPSIPRLVRDCAFVAQFPEFRPRLWVLFEVAAFTFNRAEAVGLPCTDPFEKHLLQMKGDGVRLVLDRYRYDCTNKGDREWVINSLEILLALRKTVPSIHTRRQILNAIDNSAVRSCVHQEAGVEIDKERGILKANGTTYQFNPLPVEDGIPSPVSEVCIGGDYEMRLGKALRRADESFDDAGVGEIARKYDRAGDYKIAEVLHQRAVAICGSHDLTANLENQERYEDAVAQCRRDVARPGARIERQQKLVALQHKQALLSRYRKWKLQPLEASLQMGNLPGAITPTQATRQPALRNGLKRSWLQRLDQSVWQCEDPAVMKSMEERALEFEEQGLFSEAQQIHWRLLGQRKESLGPCHVDTRRSLSNLARVFRLAGNAPDALMLYLIALPVCDFTLGPRHPESRAVIGDLATAVLLQNKPGVAKGYYRQQLERTLAVLEWDDPEAFPPKFFLQALMRDEELRIVQADEATTVDIVIDTEPWNSTPTLAAATNDTVANNLREENENDAQGGEQSRPAQRRPVFLDMESADILMKRYIIAK